MTHTDAYTANNKKYETQQPWDATKSWEQNPPLVESKVDCNSSPNRSLPSENCEWNDKREGDKEKTRSRDDRDKYWDENIDTKDTEHSKARDDRLSSRSDKDSERDDRNRNRRSDKEREWRRRDEEDRDRDRERDRDRYTRDKDRKEREGSAKDDGGRDRSKLVKERDRSSIRDERSGTRGRRERDRSIERPWREKSTESSDVRHR